MPIETPVRTFLQEFTIYEQTLGPFKRFNFRLLELLYPEVRRIVGLQENLDSCLRDLQSGNPWIWEKFESVAPKAVTEFRRKLSKEEKRY